MYGRECEYCGAILDPGEICDCRKENNNTEETKMAKTEVYSEWLDRLTIEDIEKMAAQGYRVTISNGHIIAVLPEGKELNYEA